MRRFGKLSYAILLFFALLFLLLQGYLSLTSSLNETGKLTFIKEVPEENYIFKSFANISGEVNNPGVYEINSSSRIVDLIEMAGGITENADPNYISETLNLSKILKDQEKLFIPAKETLVNKEITAGISNSESLVELNKATIAQLMELPGVGESTAKKIIDARPFNSIEDLLDVSGIGESKFNQIKELVYVQP